VDANVSATIGIEAPGAPPAVVRADALQGDARSGNAARYTPVGPVGPGPRPSGRCTKAHIAQPQRGAPDRLARRVLRVRDRRAGAEVHNIFSSSIVLSGTRCLLSYVVLPVLAPWLGTLPLVGPAIGAPVGLLALVFDVRAIRRFFLADHRWRWVAAVLYLTIMVMVSSLVLRDISRLAGQLS
jgi:hypothetical protein